MSEIQVGQINSTDGSTAITTGADGYVSFAKTQIGGRRNLIINGAMQVAQRGTSFTPTTINTYSLDRWRSEGYSYDVDVTQQTFTSGQTDVDGFPVNYVTVALNETISAGEYWSFQQRIEKPQMILEGTQTFTLSFWARATSGTVAASTFSYGIGTRQNNPELTTTWQKITYTSTYTVPSSGAYRSCHLIYFSAGATATSIDIAQVQLEVGTVATPFEHRSYGEELALCQRYFCKIENTVGGGRYFGILQAYQSDSVFGVLADYPQVMRTTPSVSQSGTFGYYKADSGLGGAGTTITNLSGTSKSWQTGGWGGSSVLTAGHAVVTFWESGAYLTADAEL